MSALCVFVTHEQKLLFLNEKKREIIALLLKWVLKNSIKCKQLSNFEGHSLCVMSHPSHTYVHEMDK